MQINMHIYLQIMCIHTMSDRIKLLHIYCQMVTPKLVLDLKLKEHRPPHTATQFTIYSTCRADS